MKILWKGNIFNPTGVATAGREYCKALLKLGHEVQAQDIWNSHYKFNEGLEILNKPIDGDKCDATIFFDYPQHYRDGYNTVLGGAVHEGTRLWPGWAEALNKTDVVWVPSNATKNLFKWNGVDKKIVVVPHGVDPDIYKPGTESKEGTFVFLSVNSWHGGVNDRKGTDLLIKAFDEEFKDEDVRLLLKVSAFWDQPFDVGKAVYNLLGHTNDKILFNNKFVPEDDLVGYYQKSHCFVAPTRGEGFGLTILNALACGLPVVTTKDNNSGHMDFCKNNPAVIWVDAPTVKQGDPRFYVQGNMFAEPSLDSLKKQMRFAYDKRKEMEQLGLQGAEMVRKDWTWEKGAQILVDTIKGVKNGGKEA
jgi:glycosyltransferase involved in cell wall biosynthesis